MGEAEYAKRKERAGGEWTQRTTFSSFHYKRHIQNKFRKWISDCQKLAIEKDRE